MVFGSFIEHGTSRLGKLCYGWVMMGFGKPMVFGQDGDREPSPLLGYLSSALDVLILTQSSLGQVSGRYFKNQMGEKMERGATRLKSLPSSTTPYYILLLLEGSC